MLVTFNCQAIGWYPNPSVSWLVDATTVDRGDYNTSSLQDPSGLFNSSSVLQIKAEKSTAVECWASVSAALAHQTSRVNLTVVAPETTEDYTVVIAVIVSVCTIILLAVLILILCYRKKLTKLSSENKVSSSSWTVDLSSERRCVADETRGNVNPGYNAEDVTSSGHSDLRNRADSTIHIISPPRVIGIPSPPRTSVCAGDSIFQGSVTVGHLHESIIKAPTTVDVTLGHRLGCALGHFHLATPTSSNPALVVILQSSACLRFLLLATPSSSSQAASIFPFTA
ncbi:hypothetical protein DPX16_4295 [Anabarilius grahami]|uniref:Ig-like domain-containing protein n=1 Tax=Anabarilius grahami TaxID=495550 RepID=A0A3N0YDB4_ANAGA|nr:hypothetical protein DPX16_4295 [Anabarilius grahami]